MDSGASSMFLSVRYPVRPIIAIKVLHNVATNVIYSICDDQEPQGQWEAPDFVLKSTGATAENTHSNDAIVCVRRLPVADIATSPVLLNITAVSRTATCPQAAANRTSTEISDEQVKLCAEWGPLAVSANDAMSSFVAELALYGSTESEAANTSISTVIPGNWKVVGGKATGSLHTFFLARSFEPFALNLMQDNVANDEEAMPSSVEAVKVLNPAGGANQSTLSFRVLQIADLHLTGDPDYPCRPGPAGTIRVDALKAASAIAQQLTQRNSLSSTTSSNGQGDPLYNECREALTIAFVDELLDIEKPDFVVFSGDNVHTWDAVNHSLAISIFTGRVESRGIPWAAVFGNHDPDGGFDREDMLKLMVEGQQHSHVKYGPRDIGGVGNYEVNVVAPEDGPWGLKGSTVFRMYFLDSHGEIDTQTYPFVTERGGYEWIKESQIEFYRELATSHVVNEGDSEGSSSSQSAVVPAIMYFHIPIPEYDLASSSTRIGDMNEAPTRSEVNCGLFSTLLEMNDVKATSMKHKRKSPKKAPSNRRKQSKVMTTIKKTPVRLQRNKSPGTVKEKAFKKGKSYCSVVCRLNTICSDSCLFEEIKRSARAMKQIQMEVWHLVNLHFLRCLEDGLPLPDYTDKTFFDHCCAGVATTPQTHLIAQKNPK
ncbi:purple acid phosphatase [Phytophthora boehmeriae]|uniref:Purple acid phosphatase n=1 Tax=Phytophthora boehmeriae TaxID=109152 RepID=A0A8T1VMR1_9STRA|nr:purple acid phosphatase [Phytophthora boehmeriae]